MGQKSEIKATVDKIVRANGKAGAQVTITVPAGSVGSIPLGGVLISIEQAQGVLLEKKPERSPLRGDRG